MGLPTGTEIQKNMTDRSIQWEKALMEVLRFVNSGSCNYGSDTETHNKRKHFSPWDVASIVPYCAQVRPRILSLGEPALNVLGSVPDP
jgi:hypothetical protein